MTAVIPDPDACRHCDLPKIGHWQRWTRAAGWHKWVAPSGEQRKARMLARRDARSAPSVSDAPGGASVASLTGVEAPPVRD